MKVLNYKISSIESVDDIKVFKMEPLGDHLVYKPGHFAMLHALDDSGESTLHRPYSIASSPTQDYIEFCIKMVGGQMTSLLDKASIGDVYGVSGPMGHFIYEGQEKCAFIAGGTGIAPFMSILRYIRDKKITGDFSLFYSVRSRDLVIYGEELEELGSLAGINTIITLTREEPEDWQGECGRISEDMLNCYIDCMEERQWFLCGPLKMTSSLRNCLIENDVPADNIKFEGWG